jgi:pSer/pThr/pTyr-binding forkhead associated (FHA) protein
MAPMKCPTCHNELPDDQAECPVCAAEGGEPTIMFVPVVAGQHTAISEDEAQHLGGVSGYALVVETGPRAGLTFVLPEGTTTVGRHPQGDIFLDDITVSRLHCRFIVDSSGVTVEDSGSTNGTYVRDVAVERARLNPGDEVIVGKFHLIIAIGDAPHSGAAGSQHA